MFFFVKMYQNWSQLHSQWPPISQTIIISQKCISQNVFFKKCAYQNVCSFCQNVSESISTAFPMTTYQSDFFRENTNSVSQIHKKWYFTNTQRAFNKYKNLSVCQSHPIHRSIIWYEGNSVLVMTSLNIKIFITSSIVILWGWSRRQSDCS